MKKKAFLLILLIIAAGIIGYDLLRERKIEQPPCRNCVEVYSSAPDIIEECA
jgi:hypothetical protein